MILYHGTDSQFSEFDERHFGQETRNHSNGGLGVWTSLTPVLPSHFGSDILVLKIEPAKVLEIANTTLRKIDLEVDDLGGYRNLAQLYLNSDFNVLAATEFDGTLANFVILDPRVISILERVPSTNIDRLRELETLYRDDDLFSRMSAFVKCLDPLNKIENTKENRMLTKFR